MQEDFHELTRITDAFYQADLAQIKAISREEETLRAELNDLSDKERGGTLGDYETDLPLRVIGADLLWRGWIERKREMLQLRLANVLVRKARAVQDLRLSFGKSLASQSLHKQAALRQHQKLSTQATAENQARSIMQAALGSHKF